MKSSKSKSNKPFIIAAIIFLAAITNVNAQIGVPDNPEDTPAAPIDGFIGVGLIAAAALGMRRKLKQ
jgi:hypothetical protein